jgi:hypothetical protein
MLTILVWQTHQWMAVYCTHVMTAIRNACIVTDRPSGGNFLREEVRSIVPSRFLTAAPTWTFDNFPYLDLWQLSLLSLLTNVPTQTFDKCHCRDHWHYECPLGLYQWSLLSPSVPSSGLVWKWQTIRVLTWQGLAWNMSTLNRSALVRTHVSTLHIRC